MHRTLSQLVSFAICVIFVMAVPSLTVANDMLAAQAGGELGDAVVSGDIAYLGQGPSISVWKLAPDAVEAPSLVTITDPLPGLVRGLAVSGDYLFATYRTSYPDGSLAVFSLENPAVPVHRFDFEYVDSSFQSPGELVVVGDHLFLADGEAGVFSIDISSPMQPVVVGHVFNFGLRRLALSGSHLVGWGAGWLGFAVEVISIADPAAPTTAGYYSSWGQFNDAAVEGDVMVLVGDGFEVVSLADPTFPASLTTVPGSGTYVRSLLLRDGIGYLGDENGVQVWDLSDPANPVAGVQVASPADRTECSVIHQTSRGAEALMFTGNGWGYTLDLGDADEPELDYTFDLPAGTDSTAVVDLGDTLVAADFYSGLRVLDADMNSLGRYEPGIPMGGYEDLDVEGSTAYMTSWGYGLLTIDLSTPGEPTPLGSLEIPQASGVDVKGDLAYVVSSSYGNAALYITDVSDPSMPTIRATMPVSKGLDVLNVGDLVFVADQYGAGEGGLRIFDVSNPDSPAQLGHYSDCNSANGVAVSGDLALLACSNGSLHVLSIEDPAMPTQLGVYEDPDTYFQGQKVALLGATAWFGHDIGVDLVDISDPAQPTFLERLDIPSPVRGISIGSDGNPWVASSSAGLYRFAPAIFANGFENGTTSAWSLVVQ